ncbi:MAG: hypothetical protein LBJ70_05190 [Holosporales bacterium]|jgi:hypothetical protein|nr:hypothetical protein [Holosporales bacterium]
MAQGKPRQIGRVWRESSSHLSLQQRAQGEDLLKGYNLLEFREAVLF